MIADRAGRGDGGVDFGVFGGVIDVAGSIEMAYGYDVAAIARGRG